MAGQPIQYRPTDDELRSKIVERAADKGISVNEWLNRVVLVGLTSGGKLKITTTVEAEL